MSNRKPLIGITRKKKLPRKGSRLRMVLSLLLRPEGLTSFEAAAAIGAGSRHTDLNAMMEIFRNIHGYEIHHMANSSASRRGIVAYKIVGKYRGGRYRAFTFNSSPTPRIEKQKVTLGDGVMASSVRPPRKRPKKGSAMRDAMLLMIRSQGVTAQEYCRETNRKSPVQPMVMHIQAFYGYEVQHICHGDKKRGGRIAYKIVGRHRGTGIRVFTFNSRLDE